MRGILTGSILQVKALEFYNFLEDGAGEFTASVDWLYRWKKGYGLRELCICGEKLFKEKLQKLIEDEQLSVQQLYL